MNSRRVTITDIAHDCGVSCAAVSLALRGSPLPAAASRAKIESELKKRGFVYKRATVNLRQRGSSSAAPVANALSDPFFGGHAKAMHAPTAAVCYNDAVALELMPDPGARRPDSGAVRGIAPVRLIIRASSETIPA